MIRWACILTLMATAADAGRCQLTGCKMWVLQSTICGKTDRYRAKCVDAPPRLFHASKPCWDLARLIEKYAAQEAESRKIEVFFVSAHCEKGEDA